MLFHILFLWIISGEHFVGDHLGFTFISFNTFLTHLILQNYAFFSSICISSQEEKNQNYGYRFTPTTHCFCQFLPPERTKRNKPLTWLRWPHWLWMFLLLNCSLRKSNPKATKQQTNYRLWFYFFQHKWVFSILLGTLSLWEVVISNHLSFSCNLLII